jgi:hypothetical protein
MVKKVFSNGSVVSPAWLNSIQNLQFNKDAGEELFDGEYPRLTDDALSNSSDQIKSTFYTYYNRLSVYNSSGLVCDYYGGVVRQQSGESLTISPASITVADNATSYIYIGADGVVSTGSSLPPICYPMAKVVTSAGSVSTITDLRPQSQIAPRPDVQKIFGGTGSEGDYSSSDGDVFDKGVYYYNNFDVNTAHTITVNKYAKIFVSGDCTIDGVVLVDAVPNGAQGWRTLVYNRQNVGGLPGRGIGGGSGSRAGTTDSYNWFAQPYGSGGALGYGSFRDTLNGSDSIEIVHGNGGNGGGGIWIECAGDLTINGTIKANGTNAVTPEVTGNYAGFCSGSGGGSGGTVVLSAAKSLTLSSSSLIEAVGGDGSQGIAIDVNGNSTTSPLNSVGVAGGGAGGGGGQIILLSPNTSAAGATLTVIGGTAGLSHTGNTSIVDETIGGGAGGANGGKAEQSIDGSDGLVIYRNFAMV